MPGNFIINSRVFIRFWHPNRNLRYFTNPEKNFLKDKITLTGNGLEVIIESVNGNQEHSQIIGFTDIFTYH